MVTLRFILIVAFGYLFGGSAPLPQENPHQVPAGASISAVADDVQRGIVEGNVKVFAKYFARQVYIDLPGQDGAYFSDRQLYYVLENFFGARLTQQFRFTTIEDSEAGPFATGSGTFMFRGRHVSLQIYVAFLRVDGRVVITQFNVY